MLISLLMLVLVYQFCNPPLRFVSHSTWLNQVSKLYKKQTLLNEHEQQLLYSFRREMNGEWEGIFSTNYSFIVFVQMFSSYHILPSGERCFPITQHIHREEEHFISWGCLSAAHLAAEALPCVHFILFCFWLVAIDSDESMCL